MSSPSTKRIVLLRAKPIATKRTKERIKAHGPKFEHVDQGVIKSTTSMFLRAPDGWFGWLDKNELIITEVK